MTRGGAAIASGAADRPATVGRWFATAAARPPAPAAKAGRLAARALLRPISTSSAATRTLCARPIFTNRPLGCSGGDRVATNSTAPARPARSRRPTLRPVRNRRRRTCRATHLAANVNMATPRARLAVTPDHDHDCGEQQGRTEDDHGSIPPGRYAESVDARHISRHGA